jgi:hypothetical protein
MSRCTRWAVHSSGHARGHTFQNLCSRFFSRAKSKHSLRFSGDTGRSGCVSPGMPRLAAATAALAVALLALNLIALGPALASCEWSWCVGHTIAAPSSKPSAASTAPQRSFITDTRRTRIGDLYAPSPGRRVQIRDNRRNILGYIEPSGRVTDTRRQEIGNIGNLYDYLRCSTKIQSDRHSISAQRAAVVAYTVNLHRRLSGGLQANGW